MTREPTAIQNALDILNREKGELRAEIERLTAERDQWKQAAGVEASERRASHAEIERLKGIEQFAAEREGLRLEIEQFEREGLRLEIERLTAVLRECGSDFKSEPGSVMNTANQLAVEFMRRQQIAAAALENKEVDDHG